MDEIYYKVRRADVIEMHIVLLLSIAGGMLGADRAYKGQTGLAFLKDITLGGCRVLRGVENKAHVQSRYKQVRQIIRNQNKFGNDDGKP